MTFEEFVAARLPAVLRFAGVLTGDRALAEDIVQEVLIRAHARWRRIGDLDRPERYVRKMVVNEYLSWRRRRRPVPVGTVHPDLITMPDHAVGHADRAEMLADLARLPRRQRTVLVLRFYEGMSPGEIAEVLGCAPATVRSNLSRALATLRVELTAPAVAAKEEA